MVNLGKLKQIREMMKTKKTLSKEVVVGQTLGGQVQISLDGTQKITAVHIDESLIEAGQKEKIEDAIKNAHSDALKQLQKIMVQKVRSGELELPDLKA